MEVGLGSREDGWSAGLLPNYDEGAASLYKRCLAQVAASALEFHGRRD